MIIGNIVILVVYMHWFDELGNCHIGLGTRKPDFVACLPQKHRLNCPSAQFYQSFMFSLSGNDNS